MKRQITFLSLLLLFTSTIISCKKDTTSLKARMMGKWSLSKIVVSGYTGTDAVTKNGTFNYGTSADYVDFKANNDDQVEISLSGNRTIGTYIIVYEDQFTMDLNDGVNYANVNSLTTNQFQFTSKIDKTNIVKIYYLTR
ncbi:hypothetical protein EZ449_10605 [Pedobacter frigidisoli]|uniref:Lipocalin-like domain-containing protein n=1 Tax=Pedobacter frigidisoli TaxID=2530455 RepID=A0A4R0P4M0_9SPHI|nr:hypothetical protein [Pedobacter frigidisoli]TCD10264.1 hypothetical protein EZ449_10605 [Pedobacter frigidisoli]